MQASSQLHAFEALAHRMRSSTNSGITYEQAMKNASAELDKLKAGFSGWLEIQIGRLRRSAERAGAAPDNTAGIDALYRNSSEIRDVAAPMGFPLTGFVADYLCKIVDLTRQEAIAYPGEIVQCYIDAIVLTAQAGYRGSRPSDQQELIDQLDRSYEHYCSLAGRNRAAARDV